MAVTLGAFIGVRVLVTLFARPHYLAAKTVSSPVVAVPGGIKLGGPVPQVAGGWILKEITVNRAGTAISQGRGGDFNFLASHCPGAIPAPPAAPSGLKLAACVHRLGIHTLTTYQPASHYWVFQGIETAIYVALAAASIAIAFWAVRHRMT
jgi:hypothetical protein